MLKITAENITRVSEDALYLKLADLKETDDLYIMIEAELDRRYEVAERSLIQQRTRLLETLKITAEMKLLFSEVKGKKSLVLIEHLGQEFVDDYTIDETNLTVYSKVSCEDLQNNSSWICGSMTSAKRKVAQLVYWRIYNKFIRNSDKDSLELLKTVLAA